MSGINRASFRSTNPSDKSKIQLITNHELPVLFCFKTKGISKYKKVSKDKKLQLIELTAKEGVSIIEAARSLAINYSTAKSIILSHKKRKLNQSEQETSGGLSGERALPAHTHEMLNQVQVG